MHVSGLCVNALYVRGYFLVYFILTIIVFKIELYWNNVWSNFLDLFYLSQDFQASDSQIRKINFSTSRDKAKNNVSNSIKPVAINCKLTPGSAKRIKRENKKKEFSPNRVEKKKSQKVNEENGRKSEREWMWSCDRENANNERKTERRRACKIAGALMGYCIYAALAVHLNGCCAHHLYIMTLCRYAREAYVNEREKERKLSSMQTECLCYVLFYIRYTRVSLSLLRCRA